jgi:hypothetical protein
MNKLIKIKINDEKYNLDVVNCVEIVICYYLGLFGQEYQHYFLLFLKQIQSFKFTRYNDAGIIYPVNIHPYITEILTDKLNVKVNNHRFMDNNFYALIEELIANNKPVLITGNLKELYYSKSYKEKNARHVILINGFDQDKRLFKIINGEHYYVKNKSRYQQFVIPYQIVKDMFVSYWEYFQEYFICDLELSSNEFDKSAVLRECLSLLLDNHTCNLKYREIMYINEIIQEIDNKADKNHNIDEIFLRTIKYKEMFYSILASVISEDLNRNQFAEAVLSLKERIISIWEDICNTCLLGLYKNTKFDIQNKINEAITHELEMKNKLKTLNINDAAE